MAEAKATWDDCPISIKAKALKIAREGLKAYAPQISSDPTMRAVYCKMIDGRRRGLDAFIRPNGRGGVTIITVEQAKKLFDDYLAKVTSTPNIKVVFY